jgi:hypothetical protein
MIGATRPREAAAASAPLIITVGDSVPKSSISNHQSEIIDASSHPTRAAD